MTEKRPLHEGGCFLFQSLATLFSAILGNAMAHKIPEETLTEIRTRISIVEIISIYVSLRKAGKNYTGLCPFHEEKTPSFSVNDERGFFHCFGCGVGGNAFTFLCKLEGISFPEAVRRLAAKVGVSLPQAPDDPQAREQARLYRLNGLAKTYFRHCLLDKAGVVAQRYMAERGIHTDVAERFQLGYAPVGWNGLVRFLAARKAPLDKAAALGLVGERDGRDGRNRAGEQRWYDKFRHRLMFPITDVTGRPVGFGGRLVPDPQRDAGRERPQPKYLNSPESALYKKGSLVYGLFQAKEPIRDTGRVLVVEGYTDLLSLVQHNFDETVAILGTALTLEQLRLLKRFSTDIYMFFDGDDAGRRAATRAFPLCVETGVTGKGIFLPQGEDPDSFGQAYGREGLEELIHTAPPLEEFYFAQHAPAPEASAFQRAQAAKEAVAVLAPMTDTLARGALLTQVAQRFGVNEEELRRMRPDRTARQAARPADRQPSMPNSYRSSAELELIQLMLLDRQVVTHVCERNLIAIFQEWGEVAADIAQAWQQHAQQDPPADGASIDVGAFLDRLPKGVADHVSKMLGEEESEEVAATREQLMWDCIEKIQNVQQKSKRVRLQREIREAEQRGDDAGVRQRLEALHALRS